METPSPSPERKLRRFLIARHGETNFNKEKRVQGTSDASVLTLDGISQASALGVYIARRQAGEMLDCGVRSSSSIMDAYANKDCSNDDNISSTSSPTTAPPITRTWCSPLNRCQQTYAAISGCCSSYNTTNNNSLPKPTIHSDLREIELLEWQGRLRNDIKQNEVANWAIFKHEPKKLGLGKEGTFYPVVDCWERGVTNWETIRSDAASTATTTIASSSKEEEEGAIFIMSHGAIGQCMLLQALGINIDNYGKSRRYAFDNCECIEIEWGDGEECSERWRRVHPKGGTWMRTSASQRSCGGLSSSR